MISSTNDPKQEIYSEDSAWATIVSAALAIPHRRLVGEACAREPLGKRQAHVPNDGIIVEVHEIGLA